MTYLGYGTFLQRLKECRKERGKTLEEIGKVLGITKVSYYHLENEVRKSVNEEYCRKLANYYNVNPVWLMGFDVSKKTSTEEERNALDNLVKMIEENKRSVKDIEAITRLAEAYFGLTQKNTK